jgi:hypothetical protein
MTGLALDYTPEEFTLGFVADDPWTKSLVYKVEGQPAAWPAAPVIEFEDASAPDWVATLSVHEGVDDAKATWSQTVEEVAVLTAAENKKVRFSVLGITWFAGKAIKRA